MMYPFMTLNNDTEITHSEMKPDGRVKVYIETPDLTDGFHNATCYLPNYTWENIFGYTDDEITYFQKLIQDNAHLIIEFSQEGGFLNASNKTDRYFYPAIFTYEPNQEIAVVFPDLNCATSGENDDDALLSARELLGCVLNGLKEDGEDIPAPTPLSKIELPDNKRAVLVDV